jgi:hypothetical protein
VCVCVSRRRVSGEILNCSQFCSISRLFVVSFRFAFNQSDREAFKKGFVAIQNLSSVFVKSKLREMKDQKRESEQENSTENDSSTKDDLKSNSELQNDQKSDNKPEKHVSLVDDIFGGLLYSSVTCSVCKMVRKTPQKFAVLHHAPTCTHRTYTDLCATNSHAVRCY